MAMVPRSGYRNSLVNGRLVGGLEHQFCPSIGNHHPIIDHHWPIFFRVETTNQKMIYELIWETGAADAWCTALYTSLHQFFSYRRRFWESYCEFWLFSVTSSRARYMQAQAKPMVVGCRWCRLLCSLMLQVYLNLEDQGLQCHGTNYIGIRVNGGRPTHWFH